VIDLVIVVEELGKSVVAFFELQYAVAVLGKFCDQIMILTQHLRPLSVG
jgi:hypothetical protein